MAVFSVLYPNLCYNEVCLQGLHCTCTYKSSTSADPEGGTGGPDPPGKSQVIWVSIGNKQLDPPPPPPPPPRGPSWTPPLENVGPPLEP